VAQRSLPLPPGFESQRACLSPPRCLTCLLGLQGVQWVRGLVLVRVSWPGHPGLQKNKKKVDKNSPHAINYHTSQLLMMNCMLCANFVMNHFLLEFLTCVRMHKECFVKLNYLLKLYKYKKGFL
jgi:hypothetical protein